MPGKISVGASSFAKENDNAVKILESAGYTVEKNPFGRKLNQDETIRHLEGAVGLLAGLETLNNDIFEKCPGLKSIARIGIGMDNVDIAAAAQRGIKVSNTPDAPTYAVAEMTVAALLSIARRIIPANRDMHKGKWTKHMGLSLKGAKIAVIGYGRIGYAFAELLKPFGVEVLICDPVFEISLTLDKVLANADIVSLHVSGKDEIIGKKELALMKPGTILLNSSRGALVNEPALIESLSSGSLGWYWGDVFEHEPYSGPLTKLDNAVLTPHISTYTALCREEMETAAARNILRDLGAVIAL